MLIKENWILVKRELCLVAPQPQRPCGRDQSRENPPFSKSWTIFSLLNVITSRSRHRWRQGGRPPARFCCLGRFLGGSLWGTPDQCNRYMFFELITWRYAWSMQPWQWSWWSCPWSGYSTVPKSQGDPKIVKRGPKGDPSFGKKGTQRGPFLT